MSGGTASVDFRGWSEMLIDHIDGATRTLGKSQGYIGLPVRDEIQVDPTTNTQVSVMVTAWRPLPDELERIMAGAPIYLHLFGTQHPPVRMEVGDVPA